VIKDILKDGFYYLISKSIVGILSLLVIWITLKVYGVEIYGQYSVLYVLTLTVSNLCFTWLAQSYIRMYKKDQKESYLTKIGFIYSSFSCLCILIIVSIYFDYNYFFCALLAISNGAYCVGRSVLQAQRNIRKFFYYDLIRILIQLCLAYILSFVLKGFQGLVYANAISCLVFIYAFRSFFGISKTQLYRHELLRWVKFGAPVALWLTIASGQLLLDRKIISVYLPSSDLGSYSAVYDSIIRICALIVIPLSNACYPILVANDSKNISYRKIGFYLSISSIIIALLMSLLVYITYNYATQYINLYLPRIDLCFLIFGVILWQLGMLYQKPLEMQNKTIAMLINILFCLVLSGVINIYYVKSLGIGIFPITVSISALVYLILTFLWIKNDL